MNTDRSIAIAVGLLFLAGTSAGIISGLSTQAILNDPHYLRTIAANPTPALLGSLCWLMMYLLLPMVPVLLYPMLKHQHPHLALGYVIFRGALETGIGLIMAICQLLLILISQQTAAALERGPFEAIGAFVLHSYLSINPLLIITFSLGGLMLYTMLDQSRLLPRWLTVWGFVAILLHGATAFLLLFQLVRPDDSAMLLIINLPIFLQELVMAGWLIGKGFNSPSKRSNIAVIAQPGATR